MCGRMRVCMCVCVWLFRACPVSVCESGWVVELLVDGGWPEDTYCCCTPACMCIRMKERAVHTQASVSNTLCYCARTHIHTGAHTNTLAEDAEGIEEGDEEGYDEDEDAEGEE